MKSDCCTSAESIKMSNSKMANLMNRRIQSKSTYTLIRRTDLILLP